MDFHVFVSYRRSDSDRVIPLVYELRRTGLEVFVDRDGVREFDNIQDRVAVAISASKVFVAWYSRTYLESDACQCELMTALRSGNPERLLVVNPEPDDRHILPTDLKSFRYSDCADLEGLAERIKQKTSEFATEISCSGAPSNPRFFGEELTGSQQFVGRLRELFLLHGALQQQRTPMLTGQQRTIVQVQGIAGVGKTLFAAEYGFRFESFYPGGVFWLRAPGADGSEGALDTSIRQTVLRQNLQGFHKELGIKDEATSIRELRTRLGEHLASGLQSLWIVDDMPSGLKDSEFLEWVSPHLSTPTLVTMRDKGHQSRGTTLELNGFSPEEGRALLSRHGLRWSAEQEVAVQGSSEGHRFPSFGYRAVRLMHRR